jgi:hypothetical protein
MVGGEPRSETVTGLPVLVDANHLDEPVLYQSVERVEVFLTDVSHAAIVARARHQIMIARPTKNAARGIRLKNGAE